MEYVQQRGSFDDLPLQQIFDTFVEIYHDWQRDEQGKACRVTALAADGDDAFGA